MEKDDRAPQRTVLIAEDNLDLRNIFAKTFERIHFAVRLAEDGIEAIESLKADPPDILILDINMPRVSGLEVLRFVRENPATKAIKVVLVTGNGMAMQSPEAEYADLVLIKPVYIADLMTLAKRLMPESI